jgi:hypothetical protein
LSAYGWELCSDHACEMHGKQRISRSDSQPSNCCRVPYEVLLRGLRHRVSKVHGDAMHLQGREQAHAQRLASRSCAAKKRAEHVSTASLPASLSDTSQSTRDSTRYAAGPLPMSSVERDRPSAACDHLAPSSPWNSIRCFPMELSPLLTPRHPALAPATSQHCATQPSCSRACK